MTLADLRPGETGVVKAITSFGTLHRRLLDLGLVPGTKVQVKLVSPAGNPIAYQIRGAVIALRLETAEKVIISQGRY